MEAVECSGRGAARNRDDDGLKRAARWKEPAGERAPLERVSPERVSLERVSLEREPRLERAYRGEQWGRDR